MFRPQGSNFARSKAICSPAGALQGDGRGWQSVTKWNPCYDHCLARFSDKIIIPSLSEARPRPARLLEETCQHLALHMMLEIGDTQLLNNVHVLRSYWAYKDQPPPHLQRHPMRLWLTSEGNEGGQKLPTTDSRHQKRGGIQVNDAPPRAPPWMQNRLQVALHLTTGMSDFPSSLRRPPTELACLSGH